MGYLYTVVWLLIAGYMLYFGLRRNRTPIIFILSGFLVFLAGWELVDTISELNLKTGMYGWIYRGVALVVLVICLIWMFRGRRERKNKDDSEE